MEEKGMKKKKKLLRLFIETFYLSAFTFGGGYMIVSLMKKKFVNEYHWIEEDEMLDLVAICLLYTSRNHPARDFRSFDRYSL